MQQVSLSVADEVKALGDALASLIIDIKGKKPVASIVSDVLPSLVSAVGGYASFAADLKSPDDQAYLAYVLAKALEAPVPAPAPVAA